MGRGAWAWCCYNRCLPIRAGRGGHVLPPATRLATAAVAPSCWHWRKGNAGGSGRASVRAAITGVGTKGGAWGVGGTKRYDTAQPTRDQGGKRSVLPLRLFTLPGQLGEVRGASVRRPRHHRVDSKRIMLVLFFYHALGATSTLRHFISKRLKSFYEPSNGKRIKALKTSD